MKSVLQDWVTELPLMQQAVLISAVRGCDGTSKHDPAKYIVRSLRGVVLNAARPEFIAQGRVDVFMIADPDHYISNTPHIEIPFQTATLEFIWDMDAYPIHYVTHLAHAAEIIGYKYPRDTAGAIQPIGYCWSWLYHEICRAFHMEAEDEETLDVRLNY